MRGTLIAQDIVRAEMHHDDIWTRRRQPAGQLSPCNDPGGQDTTMAFVGPVVAEPAPLARQGTNKVCVSDASSLESLPEEGTPASLRVLEAWFGWDMVFAVI